MSLPEVIQHQDFLLTLNTNEESIVKDALPGVDVYPLFLDPENGTWVIRAKFAPGITLPKHFHTGVVHFYTLSGAWHYMEYPDQVGLSKYLLPLQKRKVSKHVTSNRVQLLS